MLSNPFPTWVYWALAGLGVAGATAFTIYYELSGLGGWQVRKLMFMVWGGPITLVLIASVVTWIRRQTPE